MTHDTKNFIDMAEHTKQIQHLEGKIQKRSKKGKDTRKEAINCNAERKLKEMNKHCTDQLEKQQKIIEEQQLILCNGTEAQLAAHCSKSGMNQEAKDLHDNRRQVSPKLMEGVENKMYETKQEGSRNVKETKAIKDKDQEQSQKDENG